MKSRYNPKIHHRRSIRLKGYNYSRAGLYFITICCQDRACLFGDVINGKMVLNDAGKMVENEWLKLTERFKQIVLHEYIVMPNHFHAILEITVLATAAGATPVVAPNDTTQLDDISQQGQPQGIAPAKKTVGDMVGAFQSIVTVEYIRGVKTLGWPRFNGKLWQRNYWDNIIRNEQSYRRISNYIISNPQKWDDDKFFWK